MKLTLLAQALCLAVGCAVGLPINDARQSALVVNSPSSATQGETKLITWSGGQPPYSLTQTALDEGHLAVTILGLGMKDTSYQYTFEKPGITSFLVMDATGSYAGGAPAVVAASKPYLH